MSSIYITSSIIILIGALVCYAFVSQTLEKKRKQKQRLLGALKNRIRIFKYIISGFPADFLPKELSILVHRSLVQACEQMAQLDNSDPQHLNDLQLYTGFLEDLKRKNKPAKRVKLESAQQIKDVKRALEELNKYLQRLEAKGTINKNQLAGHTAQIKKLVLQISVDGYLINAKQAHQAAKLRLAHHYYTLAHKLLLRENTEGVFSAQIEKLASVISQLHEQLRDDEPEYEETEEQATMKAEASDEWSSFDKSDDNWKKKNVYD